MPLTAAEQRNRRRAVKRAARRANSSVCHDDSDSGSDGADDAFAAEPNDGARSPLASPGGGAGGSRSGSRLDSDGTDSDIDGPDDSDSDAKPTMARAPPLHRQVAAGRTRTTATTASVRPFPTPPRTSCPTATLLRALLLTGLLCCGIASAHSNCCTTVACAHRPQPLPHLMHVRARFPCRISSFWREQPHAALSSHSCQLLP